MDILKFLFLKRKLHLLLFTLAFLIFSIRLYDGPLRTYDECYYAQQAREILITGDFLSMHHALGINYENDPFFLWSMAIMFKLFGVNEFCARFPSAIYGLLSVITIFAAGASLKNYRFGLLAASILATTWEFIRFSRYAHLDVCLAFFSTLSLYFFIKFEIIRQKKICLTAKSDNLNNCFNAGSRHVLFYAALCGLSAGAAVLSKNLPGVFTIIAIVAYYLIKGNYNFFLTKEFLVILFFTAFPPGAWYLYQYAVNGSEFFEIHFVYILFKRAFYNPVEAAPVYQYIKILALTYIPWFPVAAAGLYLILKKRLFITDKNTIQPADNFLSSDRCGQKFNTTNVLYSSSMIKNDLLIVPVLYVVIYIGVMSLASAKKGWYIMPVYPQMSLITAFALLYYYSRITILKVRRERILKFISGVLFFMIFTIFTISVLPVDLYRQDNAGYKNEIAVWARTLKDAAYNKNFIFQPVGFDCDYFDYQLPLVFYTGILPRRSIKASEIKKTVRLNPSDAKNNPVFFSEHNKYNNIIKESGLNIDSYNIILKTNDYVIYKINENF